jgi:Flp pilus assembly protein TadG
MSIVVAILAWLSVPPKYIHRAPRFRDPELKAHYWDGANSSGHHVKDISVSGAYLYSRDRLYVGTVLTLILQKAEASDAQRPSGWMAAQCRVVRVETEGMGVSFMFDTAKERKQVERFVKAVSGRRSTRSTDGQALVEFALMVPVLFFLVVNAVNFGGFIYAWITVANAARASAQYAVLGGASAGAPVTPTNAQVQSLLTGDTSSLPTSVAVCINRNATTSAIAFSTTNCLNYPTSPAPPTPPAIPADPEAPQYASVAVDVTYNFSRFFTAFRFPGLGINGLATFPTYVHRRTLMRSLQ